MWPSASAVEMMTTKAKTLLPEAAEEPRQVHHLVYWRRWTKENEVRVSPTLGDGKDQVCLLYLPGNLTCILLEMVELIHTFDFIALVCPSIIVICG